MDTDWKMICKFKNEIWKGYNTDGLMFVFEFLRTSRYYQWVILF